MADVTEIDYTCNPPIIVERDFTNEEIAQRVADIKEFKATQSKLELEAKARQEARKLILDRLGITAEEAAILLG